MERAVLLYERLVDKPPIMAAFDVKRALLEGVAIAPADPNNFTGEVWAAVVTRGVPAEHCRLHLVQFAPRARTTWHTHEFVQHLIVLEGTAVVGFEKAPATLLQRGESIRIDPGTLHWHGATPDGPMAHLAVNFAG